MAQLPRRRFSAVGCGFNLIPWLVKLDTGRQRLTTAVMFLRSSVAQILSRGDGPATRYTLWRNAACIIKI